MYVRIFPSLPQPGDWNQCCFFFTWLLKESADIAHLNLGPRFISKFNTLCSYLEARRQGWWKYFCFSALAVFLGFRLPKGMGVRPIPCKIPSRFVDAAECASGHWDGLPADFGTRSGVGNLFVQALQGLRWPTMPPAHWKESVHVVVLDPVAIVDRFRVLFLYGKEK